MSDPSKPPVEIVPYHVIAKELGTFLGRMLFFGLVLGFACMNIGWFGKTMLQGAYTPDLPWLMDSGHYILHHFTIPTQDLYSWSFPHKVWVLYQWLFEVMLALGQSIFGAQLFFKLFILGILGLYFLLPLGVAHQHKIPFIYSLTITTAALFLAAINLSIRPLIVTSLFTAVEYILIQRYRQGKMSENKVIYTTGIVFFLWGNMHTGVVIGLITLIIMACGDALERLHWYPFSPAIPEIEGKPASFKFYGTLAFIGFLFSLVNPYGITIYSYLAHLSSENYLNNIISELQSPNFHLLNYYYLAGFMGLFILLMSKAKRVFSGQSFLLILLFTLATLYAQRFVVWAALFYAFIFPKALFHWWTDFQLEYPGLKKAVLGFETYRPLFFILLSGATLIFFLFPKLYVPFKDGACQDYIKGIQAYEKIQQPTDKLFTSPTLGSCILMVNPKTKVFIDTRFDFYQEAFAKAVRDALLLTGDWQGFLLKWEVNTVMVSKKWPLAIALSQLPRYKIVYSDKSMIIFRKKTGY